MPEMSEANFLFALDLGTTTLAGRLIDRNEVVLAEAKLSNPQRELGSDVIRRLEASLTGEGAHLQALLVSGIEALFSELLAQAGCSRADISAAAAAGNPAISHLLRNLPVEALLFPPHRPRERAGVFLDPADLGIDLPVPLYLFPLVSGYVGGDLVAFLYGEESGASPLTPHPSRFFLDIGTNGEMALFDGQGWLTTSVAAGPAFEAGEISCGMAVQPGAVASVRLEGDSLRLSVIGGGPPRGICGSGLAAVVAAALDGGLIDRRGNIVEAGEVATNLARHIADTPSGRALSLYRDAAFELLVTQQDIRNFQLAKGALKAGAECLMARAGLDSDRIGEVVVTGAFGFSLAPEVLKRVALLPPNMVDKVRFAAAGALAGVCRLLIDPSGPVKVQRLADVLKPYPLSGTPAFEEAFVASLDF
jgi:uncharacterized 2Fe-2S/4Fe-4S cluster protein (DUF4445 family)